MEADADEGRDPTFIPSDQALRPVEDPGLGVHLWCVMVVYGTNPEEYVHGEALHLGADNFLSGSPPGCFKCTEPYTPELAATLCTGSIEGR
jgi:hypothetical protein